MQAAYKARNAVRMTKNEFVVKLNMDSSFWQQLWIALSLVLVIEGILPFLYPRRWRRLVAQMATIDDKTMRIIGLISMLSGVGLLFLVS